MLLKHDKIIPMDVNTLRDLAQGSISDGGELEDNPLYIRCGVVIVATEKLGRAQAAGPEALRHRLRRLEAFAIRAILRYPDPGETLHTVEQYQYETTAAIQHYNRTKPGSSS